MLQEKIERKFLTIPFSTAHLLNVFTHCLVDFVVFAGVLALDNSLIKSGSTAANRDIFIIHNTLILKLQQQHAFYFIRTKLYQHNRKVNIVIENPPTYGI